MASDFDSSPVIHGRSVMGAATAADLWDVDDDTRMAGGRQWSTWRRNLAVFVGVLGALALVASILKFTNTLPKEAVAPDWKKDALALGLGGGAVVGAIGAAVLYKLQRNYNASRLRWV